jgi:hypothetical protein
MAFIAEVPNVVGETGKCSKDWSRVVFPVSPVGFNKLRRCPLSLLLTVYSELGCVTRATYTGNSGVFEVLALVASLFRLCVSVRQS